MKLLFSVIGFAVGLANFICFFIMFFQIVFFGITSWVEPNLIILTIEIILLSIGFLSYIIMGVEHFK